MPGRKCAFPQCTSSEYRKHAGVKFFQLKHRQVIWIAVFLQFFTTRRYIGVQLTYNSITLFNNFSSCLESLECFRASGADTFYHAR